MASPLTGKRQPAIALLRHIPECDCSSGFRPGAKEIIVLLLLFGGGGGYYGYSRWGSDGGLGFIGTVVLIAVVLCFLGAIHA